MRDSALKTVCVLSAAVFCGVGADHVSAQCTDPKMLPSVTTPYPIGVNGEVAAMTWFDPDGPGPQQPNLVIGGNFTVVGETAVNHLAMFDGVHWRAFGNAAGLPAWTPNWHLQGGPNGNLFLIDQAPNTAYDIYRWNGSSWSTITTPVYFPWVASTFPNGDLVVSGENVWGEFGDQEGYNVARWDGTSWQTLGSGVDGIVQVLLPLPDGDLIVGGSFDHLLDGTVSRGVARWSPTSGWSAMNSGSYVFALAQLQSGEVIGAGWFRVSNTDPRRVVKKWTGTAGGWVAFGEPFGSDVAEIRNLQATGDGNVFAVAHMTNGQDQLFRYADGLWKLHAGAIQAGSSGQSIRSLLPTPTGGLIVGGDFAQFGAYGKVLVPGLVEWTGGWYQSVTGGVRPMGSGGYNSLFAPLPGNQWLALNSSGGMGDAQLTSAARWTGQSWGSINTQGFIYATATLPGGDTVVGGAFSMIGDKAISNIARYNGVTWSAIPGAPAGQVRGLKTLSDGRLVVGCAGSVWIWDQTNWTQIGQLTGNNATAYTALLLSNGDIAVAGKFSAVNGVATSSVARWDGSQWQAMGNAFGTSAAIKVLEMLPNGDLYAGGDFFTVNGVQGYNARWDGTAWSPLGGLAGYEFTEPALVEHAVKLSSGDLLMAGEIDRSIARFDGASWHTLPGPDFDFSTSIGLSPQNEVFAQNVNNQTFRIDLTGVPFVGVHPKDRGYWAGAKLVLGAAPSTGYSNVTVQWRRNGVPITDGAGGASAGGGVVSGASHAMSSPTQGEPAELTITNIQVGDTGQYTAVFTTPCGSVETHAATVTVTRPPCGAADMGQAGGLPGSDGVLDNNDFIAFINAFFAQQSTADRGVAGGLPGHDGQFDNNDFIAFINQFFTGC